MKNIFIIGFGRFGQVIAKMMDNDFHLMTYDTENYQQEAKALGATWVDIDIGINNADIIIYAVPISTFKEVFLSHIPLLEAKQSDTLIMDIQSIKVIPKSIYDEHLPEQCHLLLTHPMFGPDSLQTQGLDGLKIMMDKHRCPDSVYDFWKNYFAKKNLEVIEISSEEHDTMAARSQSLVFFLARVLEDFEFKPTPIDTLWVEKLHEITQALTKDSWQLFFDLQNYNPFTRDMRVQLGESLHKIFNKLLPKHVQKGTVIIGIHGSQGDNNEQSVQTFLQQDTEKEYELRYFNSTTEVFHALYHGDIDLAQCAVHRQSSGIVQETLHALANYRLTIVGEYTNGNESELTSFLMVSR